MHALAKFNMSEKATSTLSVEHKLFLKNLIVSALRTDAELDEQLVIQRGELVMTFVEGMIIRNEFENTLDNRFFYRAAIHTLAFGEG